MIAYYWGAEAWDDLVHAIRTTAEYCLAMAMAAVALGTSFTQLKGLGFKPFLVGIAAAVSVGAVSIVLVFIFAPPHLGVAGNHRTHMPRAFPVSRGPR